VSEQIILFGAGAAGRYALKHLREKGSDIDIAGFADNEEAKQGTAIDRIGVMSPEYMRNLWSDATWVCCAISRPAATEIRAQIKAMGVKTKPLWECIPVFHGNPTHKLQQELIHLVADAESVLTLQDLYEFRAHPNYEKQRDPAPISELYFPDFITHLDEEVFVDAGACQGDTIELFTSHWTKWKYITAYEPDPKNYAVLFAIHRYHDKISLHESAVCDVDGYVKFEGNGDYSSRIGRGGQVAALKLDSAYFRSRPTYIKMDIEGAEVQALWGARKLLKEHKPVLAICAYHESDHTWEIPLLVHAINPAYKCYFRRYAEGAFELVWYFVPPERVK